MRLTTGGWDFGRSRTRAHAALRRHLDEDLAHGFAAGSRCAMEFTLS